MDGRGTELVYGNKIHLLQVRRAKCSTINGQGN